MRLRDVKRREGRVLIGVAWEEEVVVGAWGEGLLVEDEVMVVVGIGAGSEVIDVWRGGSEVVGGERGGMDLFGDLIEAASGAGVGKTGIVVVVFTGAPSDITGIISGADRAGCCPGDSKPISVASSVSVGARDD